MNKSGKNKLAIFDIDGTIFRRSLMVELMKELVYDGIFPKEAENQVEKEYHDWVNRKCSYQLYIDKVVGVFKEMIKGCRQDEVVKSGIKVIQYFRDRRYVYARNLLEELRETHFLLSISGSPIEVVDEYNKYLKFDKIIGTIFEVDAEGRYTGEILLNGAREKEKIFDKFLKENNIDLKGSVGIGDTEYDSAFLNRVERPIAFNPNGNLVKIAKEKGWEMVIEKKDIICVIRNGKASIRKYNF
jgi:HAD superfamily hydrolase (TIGR01490 family)